MLNFHRIAFAHTSEYTTHNRVDYLTYPYHLFFVKLKIAYHYHIIIVYKLNHIECIEWGDCQLKS